MNLLKLKRLHLDTILNGRCLEVWSSAFRRPIAGGCPNRLKAELQTSTGSRRTRLKAFMALCVTLLAMPFLTHAQESTNAAEQLKQYLAEFKGSPTNIPLREKIIRLVATMNPKPEIPEEARRHFVKANTLMKDAKAPSDYDAVMKEYNQAIILAPWWPDVIYNAAMAREAQGRYQSAIGGLKWFLLTKPSETEARAAQDRIYALEAKLEKAEKDKVEQQKRDQEASAEQQRREQAAAKQRQEEEAKRAKAQDLAGEWRWDTGSTFIEIVKSGNSYTATIPDNGRWLQVEYVDHHGSTDERRFTKERGQSRNTIEKFWVSGGTTIHFLRRKEFKDKKGEVTTFPLQYTLTLSSDGSKLEGKDSFQGREDAVVVYRKE